MILQIYNILTPEEKNELLTFYKKMNKRSSGFDDHPVIKKIADTYQAAIGTLKLGFPSYWVIESRASGHGWHYDGCVKMGDELVDNHMSWCQYGSSICLSEPEDYRGGDLWLKPEGEEEFKVHNHYLTGCIYSAGKNNNPVLHQATPHSGKRKVLLMFFGE